MQIEELNFVHCRPGVTMTKIILNLNKVAISAIQSKACKTEEKKKNQPKLVVILFLVQGVEKKRIERRLIFLDLSHSQ